MKNGVLIETKLSDIPLLRRGKVRDIYILGDKLLIIATDRISAFDSVLPTGIPDKGKILTLLSTYWFRFTEDIVENHLITIDTDFFPPELQKYQNSLDGRAMLVMKAERIDIECVVRGYLAGSAWKEYQRSGKVCGISLPTGLKEGEILPFPIFTPATKSDSGHDENISEEKMKNLIGVELTEQIKEKSLQVYAKASEKAESQGIIISDTKFEFGTRNGILILIDELLTPDSSRFWPRESYRTGTSQPSFDKQYIRDYLEEIKWDKNPPAPALPPEIVIRTREKYLEALQRITGERL